MIYILPMCTCGHGWLVHTDDNGAEGPCIAEDCDCPFYRPQ